MKIVLICGKLSIMKNLNTIILLFAGVLYLTVCIEAKCRGKNAVKLKRSLRLAISSDDINNRHKAGLRNIFRRKRDTKDEEATESDKFTAEIKFLQKWNPAMSSKDGSAYRLFQGNVLDAILEQLNADRRFINSHVLGLKKAPDGILAKVGFHFKKSERNPISHIRFVVSRGQLSSLKVDKRYFKILKTPANFPDDLDKEKASNHHQPANGQNMSVHSSGVTKQKPTQNLEKQQIQSESSSATVSTQTEAKPENQQESDYPTQNQPSTGYPNQGQSETAPWPQTLSQASPQNQATNGQSQDQNIPVTGKSPEQAQDTAQEEAKQQTQVQSQNSIQSNENAQVTENGYPASPTEAPYKTQQQNVASYQQATQSNDKLTQTTPNPYSNVNDAQTQYNNQWNDEQLNRPNPKPAKNTQPTQAPSDQQNQKNEESVSLTKNNDDEENVSVKMNQAWFPFLSNHNSPQYKMLAGNLEKGLKSATEDDKNIKDVKVKDLLQADEGHTTVKFLVKFNGGKEASTEKLRKIVKTGDIAGISVDSTYFKIE